MAPGSSGGPWLVGVTDGNSQIIGATSQGRDPTTYLTSAEHGDGAIAVLSAAEDE
jgi:hypothetical protein